MAYGQYGNIIERGLKRSEDKRRPRMQIGKKRQKQKHNMKLKLSILLASALVLTSGCAGFRAGVGAVRTTVNKGFDIVDKAAEAVENTTKSAVGGTVSTVTTATTSAPAAQ